MKERVKTPLHIGYLMQQDVDIINPPFDGPAIHVREVINALISQGHKVRVVMSLEGKIWITDDLRKFDQVIVKWMDQGPIRLFERMVRRVQFELRLPYAALFESVRFAWACCQQLKGFDLFYERMSWGNFGGALAAQRCDIPLVLENNGDHLFDLEMKNIAPTGLQLWLSTTLMKRSVRGASHSVASGEGWRNQYLSRWQIDKEQVTTIENGTSLVDILDRSDLRSFSEPPFNEFPVNIIYIGGFYPWHGIPILLQTLARVVNKGLDVNLVAIGSGPGHDDALKIANELELRKRVNFAGQLTAEQFAPLLAQADIAVAPYCGWPEFSGLKIFDYKASGLATIASGERGQPATLQHGKTGWIVPPCDEHALSEAIFDLSTDSELRRRLGQAARLEAESSHGWEHTANDLERLFFELISKKDEGMYPAAEVDLEEVYTRS